MRKSLCALLALAAGPLFAQDVERWDLTDARVTVRLNPDLLGNMGVRISPAGPTDRAGYVSYEIGAQGALWATAPGSLFRTVVGGELELSGGPALRSKETLVSFAGASLRPGAVPSTYVIDAADGSPLFVADHQHFKTDREARTLRLYNLDLRLARGLARRLGHALLANTAVGQLEIEVAANIPLGSVERPDGACTSPNWGLPDNDVALIDANGLQQFANAGGIFAAAPSATLRNVGTTDVPWQEMFSPPAPPYNADQHPFLVWNMYRIVGGRLEQIGASGAKHAFLTINNNCTCSAGSILWAGPTPAQGCEDTYGSGTNNDPSAIGPRTEVTAHTGIWQRCGSIFDPDCNGVPNQTPGFSGAADPRRMTVAATDVTNVSKGTQFYYDAWYVVRDDVNIFNTMQFQRVTPTLSGSTWSFPAAGSQVSGSVVDAWVNPTAPGPNADNKRVDTGEGHLTVGVRATNVSGSLWRYDYAVHNHDFDRRIKSFTAQVPIAATVSEMRFHDVDRNPATDWLRRRPWLARLNRPPPSRPRRRTGACSTASASWRTHRRRRPEPRRSASASKRLRAARSRSRSWGRRSRNVAAGPEPGIELDRSLEVLLRQLGHPDVLQPEADHPMEQRILGRGQVGSSLVGERHVGLAQRSGGAGEQVVGHDQ
jgi:hypothetical protein